MNSSSIPSADSSMYITTANGLYHVEYTNEMGCKVNSDTLNFTTTSISAVSSNLENFVNAYPNPTSDGQLKINVKEKNDLSLTIINPIGQVIIKDRNLNLGVNLIELEIKGVYQIQISNKSSNEFINYSVVNL